MNKPDRIYRGQKGYMQLISDILVFGEEVEDRTGLGRIKLVGQTMKFDLENDFPAFGFRKTPIKHSLHEFWAFLNGKVFINQHLKQFGVKFWEGNTSREFLDKRGLKHLPEGHSGKSYAFQFCHAGGELDENFQPVGGINQVKRAYDTLINSPFSSQNIIDIMGVDVMDQMSLPPCWFAHAFTVTVNGNGEKVLSCTVFARSVDVVVGTPANLAQYATYITAIANSLGMRYGEMTVMMADVHIYGKRSDFDRSHEENHPASQVHFAYETLSRSFDDTPVNIEFKNPLKSLEDVLDLAPEDIILNGHSVNTEPYATPMPIMAI